MILPIEVAHYNHWAWRLEVGLATAFPGTRWRIPRLHELAGLPRPAGIPPWFRVVATAQDGKRAVIVFVKSRRLVHEAVSTRLLVALGWELEQRLQAMIEE